MKQDKRTQGNTWIGYRFRANKRLQKRGRRKHSSETRETSEKGKENIAEKEATQNETRQENTRKYMARQNNTKQD
jgi:hypothetical protein